MQLGTGMLTGYSVTVSRAFRILSAQGIWGLVFLASIHAQQVPEITILQGAGVVWERAEFRVTNVPPALNVFDPDEIRVDASFTLPSSRTIAVAAFWYQSYQRNLSGGNESLTAMGAPEWRLRFTPPETGNYSVQVCIRTNGQVAGVSSPVAFTVSNTQAAGKGFVRLAPGGQYFETGNGQPLKLIGENVCWHGSRGTYDYDNWFSAMQTAGENFARLWMWPHAFGLEVEPNSLCRYRLDRAWQLDYVMQLAEQRGIHLLLCLDYHGMYEEKPDAWGSNNYWVRNPYNSTNGGPALNQNGFFTNTTAQAIYQKRLRYIVARYGYSPNLLAWEFFNEIDNVYTYLRPTDVANWHRVMGSWLHANDPYGHLVTTSLTGSSDRPEIWSIPELDFAAYHSYNETAPATRMAQVAKSFLDRYKKPVMIGEFGIDWRGWNRANDPYLRGFRQGIWGGALGGSVGTGMSWWWESIHSDNAYQVFSGLKSILGRTGWCSGTWTNIGFRTTGSPPLQLGQLLDVGKPFSVTLHPSSAWGAKTIGQLAIPNPEATSYAAAGLNCFVHGASHPDLRVPFRLNAWLTNNARIVLHVNSVSSGAVLAVGADTTELYRTNLPNLDGGTSVNNEYNLDISINLPPGKRLIQITNPGADWFYLDWVRLENVLPSNYNPEWGPSPDSIGISGPREALVYVVAPGLSFPANATNSLLPLQRQQQLVLTNWGAGTWFADWSDPFTGTNVASTRGTTTNAILSLPIPEFREDLAGVIYPQPKLSAVGLNNERKLVLQLWSETAGTYLVETSSDLTNWTSFSAITNGTGASSWLAPATEAQAFFRVRK